MQETNKTKETHLTNLTQISNQKGSDHPTDDDLTDAEVQIEDPVAAARPFSCKPKTTKGKGNGNWRKEQEIWDAGAPTRGRYGRLATAAYSYLARPLRAA